MYLPWIPGCTDEDYFQGIMIKDISPQSKFYCKIPCLAGTFLKKTEYSLLPFACHLKVNNIKKKYLFQF